jgi:hypothetical protein
MVLDRSLVVPQEGHYGDGDGGRRALGLGWRQQRAVPVPGGGRGLGGGGGDACCALREARVARVQRPAATASGPQ